MTIAQTLIEIGLSRDPDFVIGGQLDPYLCIPVPPRVTRAVAKAILVLKALQVGESFVSHRDERDNRVRVQKECPGRKFVGRPINCGKQWRLWRIA